MTLGICCPQMINNKLVAIESGRDWSDASVHYVVLPKNIDIKVVKAEWTQWFNTVYLPAAPHTVKYRDLADWLCERYGAERALDTGDIEVFDDFD